MIFELAADVVLAMHAGFVFFVVFGLLAIIVGKFYKWQWVRNPVFRLAHVAAIGVVVLQSWLGVVCPLTTLEMNLRAMGGGATYPGAFIAHWLESLLYYHAPAWVFVVAYSLFGALVVLTWFWVQPRRFCEAPNRDGT